MTDNGTLLAGISIAGIAIVGIVAYMLLRKQTAQHKAEEVNLPPRSNGSGSSSGQSNAKRLFEEHLQAFERAYLAYLLEKEALRRHLPIETLEAFTQRYGANKGDPAYTPNLDLPKKGVPSPEVTKLMDAWLAANDDQPSDDPPSFRVRRVIKARLDKQVAEICDEATKVH